MRSPSGSTEALPCENRRPRLPGSHSSTASTNIGAGQLDSDFRTTPTHTRRSQESETLQQFSTPVALGLAVSAAAAITPSDVVLEPSAGTGLLAVFAELSGAELVLNELADARAGLLSLLFPAVPVTRFDAAHIDDHLDAGITPSVVLMNPPFSAVANVDRRVADAALRHISSALARLADGGRLVAITGASCAPDNPVWRDAFVRLQERGRVVFSAGIDGAVYARHGTTTDTRLTVIDKRAADDPGTFPLSPGMAPDVATLLGRIAESMPPRLPVSLGRWIPGCAARAGWRGWRRLLERMLFALKPQRCLFRQPGLPERTNRAKPDSNLCATAPLYSSMGID